MNDYDIVAKISIIPRGPAGGVTIFMPSEERLNSGKEGFPQVPISKTPPGKCYRISTVWSWIPMFCQHSQNFGDCHMLHVFRHFLRWLKKFPQAPKAEPVFLLGAGRTLFEGVLGEPYVCCPWWPFGWRDHQWTSKCDHRSLQRFPAVWLGLFFFIAWPLVRMC